MRAQRKWRRKKEEEQHEEEPTRLREEAGETEKRIQGIRSRGEPATGKGKEVKSLASI